jgi:hypothetical protein
MDNEQASNFLFYSSNDGKIKVQVIIDNTKETVWTTQKSMAEIFNVEVPAVSKHISNIFESGELQPEPTISKMEIVQTEGNREIKRTVDFYNLDMIIAVGYRVNSYQATQFRIWATKILKEYLTKGFALNDERLKQGSKLFGKDYFEELLEKIREIRASERRFYQKITDLYALSTDYDKNSPITQKFYATVQNKLHWAISNKTAAELIYTRASAKKPNMGLTTWKNAEYGGKILKMDVGNAKNYLSHDELKSLNLVVNMYLDYAELQASKNISMRMIDWAAKLDNFLRFNEYNILSGAGSISHDIAVSLAEREFEKYRVIQDREFKSDFDKVVESVKTASELPDSEKQEKIEPLSDFNQKLKKAIDFNQKEK